MESSRNLMLLRALNAEYLINECQKRNVSTKDLHKLTKDDFKALGADEENAERLYEALYIPTAAAPTTRRWPQVDTEILLRSQKTLIGMLEDGTKQLQLVQSFVQYAKCKLYKQEGHINYFINADIGLRASEVLDLAVNATFDEIGQVEHALDDIKRQLSRCDKKRKPPRWKFWCHNSSKNYFIIVFGIGLATCTLFNVSRLYKIPSLFPRKYL